MQQRWQLSPKPTLTETLTPTRGKPGTLVTITDRMYVRHRRSFWKLSKGLQGALERRNERVARIRKVLIMGCILAAVLLVLARVTVAR